MLRKLGNFLDNRTGYRKLLEVLLIEHIPGGAKWRYVWGSCLASVFAIQLVTGLLLMTAYSPSASTAWSSVYFIQYEMDFGWLIRGLHHFGSQTMVVLLAIHMLQVVIAGAHLPPREVNWWLGLALLGAVLGLSLTGYLLPWDQKGYWATQVATNIAGNVPVVGPVIQKIALGGPAYGNHTLTRFFALHVGVLPPLIVVLVILHLAVFRRHGVTAPAKSQGEGWFWPDQAFRDMVVGLVVVAIMLAAVLGVFGKHGQAIDPALTAPQVASADVAAPRGWWDEVRLAGRYHGMGANLDAPADPSTEYPARPEWYFLFLFQLLKYFEGSHTGELIGTIVVPAGTGLVLFLLPLLGYGVMRKFGHAVGVLVVVVLFGGVGYLTVMAFAADDPALGQRLGLSEKEIQAAKSFQEKRAEAEESAARAIHLAAGGIPPEGPTDLLRRDPLTEGKRLFGQQCAVCHNHGDVFKSDGATASDLAGFGSKEWIMGILKNPQDPKYFGLTGLKGMTEWVEENLTDLEPSDWEELEAIAGWLAGHPHDQSPLRSSPEFAEGIKLISEEDGWGCTLCHRYENTGSRTGPDFTRYGDASWIRIMIMSPHHPSRYGKNNTMPIFRDLEGPGAEWTRMEVGDELARQSRQADRDEEEEKTEGPGLTHLSDVERELIIRWMTGDHRLVFGGEPIADPKQ